MKFKKLSSFLACLIATSCCALNQNIFAQMTPEELTAQQQICAMPVDDFFEMHKLVNTIKKSVNNGSSAEFKIFCLNKFFTLFNSQIVLTRLATSNIVGCIESIFTISDFNKIDLDTPGYEDLVKTVSKWLNFSHCLTPSKEHNFIDFTAASILNSWAEKHDWRSADCDSIIASWPIILQWISVDRHPDDYTSAVVKHLCDSLVTKIKSGQRDYLFTADALNRNAAFVNGPGADLGWISDLLMNEVIKPHSPALPASVPTSATTNRCLKFLCTTRTTPLKRRAENVSVVSSDVQDDEDVSRAPVRKRASLSSESASSAHMPVDNTGSIRESVTTSGGAESQQSSGSDKKQEKPKLIRTARCFDFKKARETKK